MFKKFSFLGGISLLFLSCGSGGGSSTALEPTLSSIQSNIFNSSCALPSCHSSAASQGNLSLADGESFGELVNVLADNSFAAASGKLRVVPTSPDTSFLVRKLEDPSPIEGTRMPNSSSQLSQEEIDAIRQWITDGALDN